MDPLRIERQIQLILVTYRREQRRLDSPTMVAFRDRALAILGNLEAAVEQDPTLRRQLVAARRELRSDAVKFGTLAPEGHRSPQ